MISIDFKNVYAVAKKHGVSKKEHEAMGKKLPKHLENLLHRGQGFYSVIDDMGGTEQIQEWAKSAEGEYETIVLLGIGGSALGPAMLRSVFGNLYDDRVVQEKKTTRLIVLDNIDPVMMEEARAAIDIKKTLFLVISKSGTTPETLSQFLYFKNELEDARIDWSRHMVFITDAKKGLLRELGEKAGVTMFAIPSNVGGRFSLLTPVGLVPAALLGIDIDGLLSGARAMREELLSDTMKHNLPYQLATIQYLAGKKGMTQQVLMPYAQKLRTVADWYRQLLGESIGKAVDRKGKKVNVGLTPVPALGVTDQHSQTQLYMEGPYDKLVLFLHEKNGVTGSVITTGVPKTAPSYSLSGKTFHDLFDAERRATRDAYTKYDRANLTITVDQISPETIGALCMLFEGATAFLGELYGVDAFDQPGVELAKVLTRKYLVKK